MIAPNVKQKRWLYDVARWAANSSVFNTMYDGVNTSRFELHHVLGRSAKHNKVPIGHWFVIPVPFELHNVMSGHPDNVTHFKHRFTARFGEQRLLFSAMLGDMALNDYALPPDDVIDAIMDTKA